MKIYYWNDTQKCPHGNFGDQLNIWLWPKLIPEVINDQNQGLFVGIGTLLNTSLPINQKLAIFGSGVGYGNLPQIQDVWHIYCVRGPRTASVLKLDPKLAITDAALLTRLCYQPTSVDGNLSKQVAFMPHWQTPMFLWQQACEQLGLTFIDPGESVDNVLDKISNAKYVLTEAMHGAIIADSLRIPWIAISTRPSINTFKWFDWCESMELEYRSVNLYCKRFTPNIVTKNSTLYPLALAFAKHRLNWILQSIQPSLSKETILKQKEETLLSKLDQFRYDWQSGVFN